MANAKNGFPLTRRPPSHGLGTQQPTLCPSAAAAAAAHGREGALCRLQPILSLGVSISDGTGGLPPTSCGGIEGDGVFGCADSDASGSGSGDGDSDGDGDGAEVQSGSDGSPTGTPRMQMRTRAADGPPRLAPLPLGRRKLGRPIMFTGDPEDPGLTKDERRRIRRRAANRASAQRVRERRTQQTSQMLTQLSRTEAMRDGLHATLIRTQGEVQHLAAALQQASEGWVAESAKGSRLCSQLGSAASRSTQPQQPALQKQLPLETQHWAVPLQPSIAAAAMVTVDAIAPRLW